MDRYYQHFLILFFKIAKPVNTDNPRIKGWCVYRELIEFD
ncbi:Uncharacterised protein [Moraxella bovis]|uniref:Uncharacterized protein n=1 Tax=Moraxella bovis TaxID=476 RepID=A0A378PYY9_MORBO|nr:Uncharacterised protein [Moraxella bovis]